MERQALSSACTLTPHPLQVNKQMLGWLERHRPSPEASAAVLDLYFDTFAKFAAQEVEHLATEERLVLDKLEGMLSVVRGGRALACLLPAWGMHACMPTRRLRPAPLDRAQHGDLVCCLHVTWQLHEVGPPGQRTPESVPPAPVDGPAHTHRA
jgi:hypothetical protein